MKAEGISISRERVRLIRRREGLQVVRKRRKRKVLGMTTQWVHRACYPNHVWAYDFVFDQTGDGRQLKCLTVVDEFTRQGLTHQSGSQSDGVRCHAHPRGTFQHAWVPQMSTQRQRP